MAFRTLGTLITAVVNSVPAALEALPEALQSELARLVPQLQARGGPLPPASADPQLARARLQDATVQLLTAAAQQQPLVILIDDLQWCDEATRAALHDVAAQLSALRAAVLLLFTVRSEALPDEALRAWIARLHRALPTRPCRLGNLDAGGVRQWLTGLVPEAAVEPLRRWLEARTDGQPLFIVEALRSLRDERVLVSAGAAGFTLDLNALHSTRALPAGIQAAVQGRLDRLTASARSVVLAAAVLGRDEPLPVLAGVAQLSEDLALDALDETLAAGVLVERAGGCGFTHDRFREVALAGLSGARTQAWHRRAVQVLEGAGAERAVLAHHAHVAALWPAAVRYDLAAARSAAALSANHDVIRHLERALDALQRHPLTVADLSAEALFELHDRLNVAYDNTDDQHPRRRAVLQAMQALGQDRRDARLEVRALTELAVMHAWTPGELPLARQALDRAGALAQADPGPRLRTWVATAHFHVAARTGPVEAQLRHAEDAHHAALPTQDDALIGTCLVNLAFAKGGVRDWPGAIAAGLDAAGRLLQSQDRVAAQRSLVTVAYGHAATGDLAASVAVARQAAHVCRELGAAQLELAALRPLLSGLSATGSLGDLPAPLQRAEHLLQERDDPTFQTLCRLDVAVARHALGQRPAAEALYREVEAFHAAHGLPHFTDLAPAGLCALAVEAGRWDAAASQAQRLLERLEVAALPGAVCTIDAVVLALMHRGARHEAQRLVERLQAGTAPPAQVLAALAEATFLAATGAPPAALDRFSSVAQVAQQLGRPFEVLRAERSLAALHQHLHQPDEASRALQRAGRVHADLLVRWDGLVPPGSHPFRPSPMEQWLRVNLPLEPLTPTGQQRPSSGGTAR
ncbi:ATP-binding protein [Deinococcus sonorensis]|uniref:AAA family ATPase n=1 Tax=Deinococcus sonorensis KR-87 TaxID=694439 RepID=A0AAU7U5R6_9DEIO